MLCKVHKDGLHSAGTEFSLFKIFEELAVAAFLHKSLKGDFLHFHYHSSSLNKGCVCLTEDSLLVLKMTKEDFMTSSHLLKRQLKCSTWELLFQKLTIKVTRFWQDCIKNSEEILSACHATSMKLGKKANEKKKKKKSIICQLVVLSLPSSYSTKAAISSLIDTVTVYLIVWFEVCFSKNN